MKKILFLFSGLILMSCQRDDLCPESTPTTPLLRIEFIDAEDPTELKAPQGLLVYARGKEEILLGPTTTNTIEVPLRTDQNFTEYHLVRNSGTPTENEDIIRISYDPVPEYVNRACGFRIDYMDLNAEILEEEEGENWILSDFVVQYDEENETAAYISLTH